MPRYIRFIFLVPAMMAGLALPERTAAVEIHSKVKIREDMSITQAIMLGVIEGVTEYLPVSSTGHLLVAQRMMGIGNAGSASSKQDEHTKEAADAYAICIQAGAILAVLGLYFRRVRQMIMGALGKDETGLRMFVNIVAAFIPAAVIGVLFSKVIKVHLFGIWPVVLAWFAGGLAILAVDRWRQNNPNQATGRGLPLDQLRGRMALVIGFIQCIAMWPGVSRSLVTIVGGLVVGLSLPAAVEFSFLLGLVTLTAATAHDAIRHGDIMLETYHALPLALGLLSALLAAALSVKWMVAYLNRHSLALFGYYRLILAPLVAALVFYRII